tara:strand:- start:4068 stop:4382 length:315 start_codon:yes stop_codon:yes gene_type:complete
MNLENEAIMIGQIDDLETDSVENFEHEEVEYAIYHLKSGYYATQGLCSCNAPLSEGTIVNEEIECASCGKSFSIISGDPISDPETSLLKTFEITIEENNLYLNL